MKLIRRKPISVLLVVLLAVMALPQSVLGVTLPGATPTANPDAYTTSSDAPVVPLTANAPGVLANDGGGGLTAVLVTGPAHATSFTLNANGSFSYTPVVAYAGTDAFTYKAHNAAGDSPPATVTITLTHTNKPPVLTAGGTLTYTENGAPAPIDLTITVNDPDSATLASATATISANYQNGQDVLAFTNVPATMGNIAGSFDAATGALSLTSAGATATVGQWQAALRAVTYASTSDNPTNFGANPSRTVTWQVDDGSPASNLSNQPTSTIQITAVNDAPTVTAVGTLAYTEGDPAKAIDPTLVANDVDNQNLTGATVQITGNYQNGQDVLSFANTATITAGAFNAATGTLTLTGTDTIANWRTALRAVAYNNTSNNPDTANRTVTWIVNDGGATNNLSLPATSAITVTPVNNPPTVTAGGTLNYTENGAAAAVDNTITVNDTDSADLASATISITAGFVAGDTLAFANTATITGSYNSATGVLSLTGSDTPANYQAALRAVMYSSTSDNPTSYGANPTRTVTWTANDGASNSGGVTSTINVTAINDAPTLTAGGTLAYTEGQAATAIDATIAVTDPDSQNLTGATVAITGNYQNGQDILSFTSTAAITGAFNAATGTLTLTGSDTVANYQAALRAVQYNDTSANPNTANRTVTWQANDGAAANNLSNQPTSAITVTAVNNAPVVTAGGTLAYTENDPAAAIDTSITVTDADSANLTGATVSITGNFAAGQDLLAFATIGPISGSYNGATGVLTLTGTDTLANYQVAMRTVTYQNTSDNPSTLARTVAWVATDGTTPSAPATSTVNIAPVNDPPVLTAGAALTYTENQAATAIDNTITVTDPDSANLTGATVSITGNFAAGQDILAFANTANITGSYGGATGVLTLTGTDTVAAYQAALRAVTYSNTSDNPTIAPRTVTWQVNDGAGANNLSNQPTSTVNVTAVNDPPTLTAGGTLAYTENDPATAIDATITVTDTDSANLTSATVSITGGFQSGSDVLGFANTANITGSYNIPTGVLTLTGADTIASYQAALRSVTFSSTSDDPTAGGTKPTRTITWQVNDGAAANNLSNQPTSTVNVTAVNDPPTLTAGATLTYTAGQAATAIDNTITVTDADSTTLAGATVTITTGFASGEDVLAFTNTPNVTGSYNATTGTLTLTGTDTLASYQAALRSVTYHDTSITPATTPRTVTWQVNDGAAANNLSNQPTSTINVQVNAAPTLTASGTLSYTENQAATALNPTLTISDPDSPNMAGATVQITTNYVNGQDALAVAAQNGISGTFDTATGTLTLSGSATQANYVTALKSVTYVNTSDNPSTAARTVVWQVNDGAAANNLSNTQTTTITVTAVNDAPTLAVAGSPTFTENGSAVALATSATITDPDNTTLASATVSITSGFFAGDTLAFANTATITGVYNSGTGVLTLTGTETLANYQAALQAVTYSSTSDNPTNFGAATSRTLTWRVNDGGAANNLSNTPTSTVNITAVNDAPTLTAGATLGYTENDPATNIDTTIVVADADNQNLTGATVSITANFASAEDVLSFTTQNGISGAYNSGTGVLTLSGSSSVTNYQAALRSVKYNNSSDNPSALSRTVTWTVTDGAASSTAATSTITVTPVNDPPTLTNATITYTTAGNTQLQVAGATLPGVASITDAQSAATKAGPFADVDGPNTPTIVAASGTSANGGSFSITNTGSFTFVPAAGFTGTDTFTYQVTDGATPTPGIATGTVSITVGQRVWYVRDVVDANNAAGGDGRSTNAFDSLAAFNAATTNNGDIIFIFAGNTGTTPLSGGVTLKDGQKLWGEGIGLTVPSFGTLVAAGSKPKINNTGGDAVSVPATAGNRQNVEVQGLDLQGSGNAVDVTASGANIVGVTISNNTVSGSGVEGFDLNAGSTGAFTATVSSNTITATGNGIDARTSAATTLTLDIANNTITAGAAGTGIFVDGSGGGTTTITGFANNSVSGNTGGSGISITSATFDATASGSYQTVSGGTTTIGASGNPVGANGIVLTTVKGDLSFTDLDIFAGGGAAFKLTGNGAVNTGAGTGTRVTVGAGVAIFQATGGPAADVTNATIDLQLSSLTSTNSATTGVNLDTVSDGTTAATFSAGSGSTIANATGTSFNVNAGTAAITYNGTITNSTGRTVSVTSKTADAVTFNGAITATGGTGIFLNSNTGATISFTQPISLSTGTNAAFTATGGGTVSTSDTTSTIVTTTGTALNVANTTIGASGLKFRSISAGTAASGPANGIVLNATGASGSLTVSGTGSANSGGTIQKTTSHGISLTSTLSPSFTDMNIQNTGGSGIKGTTVTNFTFVNGTINNSGTGGGNQDSNIAFNNQTGTENNLSGTATITGNTLTNALWHGVSIFNFSGTISSATISGNTVTSSTAVASSLGSGIQLVAFGSASTVANVTNATIDSNTVTNFPSGTGIVAQAGNSNAAGTGVTFGTPGSATNVIAITNNHIGGSSQAALMGNNAILTAITGANPGSRGQANFDISNNGGGGSPLTNVKGNVISPNTFGYSTSTFSIKNNVIVAHNTTTLSPGIGGGLGCASCTGAETPDMTATISGNNVSQTQGNGILMVARDVTGSGLSGGHLTTGLRVTIQSNTVAAPLDAGGEDGIRVDSGNGSAGSNPSVCLSISSNTSQGSPFFFGIGLRKQGAIATSNLFGIVGLTPTPANNTQMVTYVQGQNTGTTAEAVSSASDNFVACTLP